MFGDARGRLHAGRVTLRGGAVAALLVGAVAFGGGAAPVKAGGSTGIVFAVRGTDGHAYDMHGFDDAAGDYSGAYNPLGGGLLGAPTVVSMRQSDAVTTAEGVPYLIATGTDHHLWTRSESAGWVAFAGSSVVCTSIPGAISVSAHAANAVVLDAACRGTDGALWYSIAQETADPSAPPQGNTSWNSLGGVMPAPVGNQLDGPAIAAVNQSGGVQDELTYFVNGTDGHVWARTANSLWQQMPWQCRGHLAAASVITQTSTGLSIFACHGTDDQLWITTITSGGSWCSTTALGGVLVDGVGIAAGPNRVSIIVQGTDGAAYATSAPTQTTCYNGSEFSGFQRLGGVLTNGATAAALLNQIFAP